MKFKNFSFLDNLFDYRGFSAEAAEFIWAFIVDGKYDFNYPRTYNQKDIIEEIKASGVIRLENEYLEAVIDLDSLLRKEAIRYPEVLHQVTISESYQGHKRAVTLFQDIERDSRIESIVERTERCKTGVLITSFRQRIDSNLSGVMVFYKTKEDIKKLGLKPLTLLSYAQLGGREKEFDSFLGSEEDLFPHKVLEKKQIQRKGKDFLYDLMIACSEEFKEGISYYTEKAL